MFVLAPSRHIFPVLPPEHEEDRPEEQEPLPNLEDDPLFRTRDQIFADPEPGAEPNDPEDPEIRMGLARGSDIGSFRGHHHIGAVNSTSV